MIAAVEIDVSVVVAVFTVATTVGMSLMAWTLSRMVKLSELVASLTADIRSLSFEVRDTKDRVNGIENRERTH